MIELDRKNCPMRADNGNCLPVGGFCTAVNDIFCEIAQRAYDKGFLQCHELLKEKQPRVLTLEEVKQADVVWCEWGCADGYVVCMLFDKIDPDGDYRLIESNGGGLYYSSSEYNESWRCWSARPTDEQMKATEWDGDGE